jgi:hypothetical protein
MGTTVHQKGENEMNSCTRHSWKPIFLAMVVVVLLGAGIQSAFANANDPANSGIPGAGFNFKDWMRNFSDSLESPLRYQILDSQISNRSIQDLSQILRVTSDVSKGYTDIRLELDDNGNIVSLRHFSNDVQQRVITPEDFAKGAVLMSSGSYEVIKLICKNCMRDSNAVIQIPSSDVEVDMRYLSNGITNSYGIFPMNMRRQGDHWGLETRQENQVKGFSEMYILGRTFFGKVIGIKEVIVK